MFNRMGWEVGKEKKTYFLGSVLILNIYSETTYWPYITLLRACPVLQKILKLVNHNVCALKLSLKRWHFRLDLQDSSELDCLMQSGGAFHTLRAAF